MYIYIYIHKIYTNNLNIYNILGKLAGRMEITDPQMALLQGSELK